MGKANEPVKPPMLWWEEALQQTAQVTSTLESEPAAQAQRVGSAGEVTMRRPAHAGWTRQPDGTWKEQMLRAAWVVDQKPLAGHRQGAWWSQKAERPTQERAFR